MNRRFLDSIAEIFAEIIEAGPASLERREHAIRFLCGSVFLRFLKEKSGAETSPPMSRDIPYLSGGPFDLTQIPIEIPDTALEKLRKTLSVYNFTIDENAARDADVSVDPEMLGLLFENLLAEIGPETGENARKRTGSFYTPAEIVDYMACSSLFYCLSEKTRIADAKLKALLSSDDMDDDALSDRERRQIAYAIAEIKILDPACGAGAFPMGILRKLVHILRRVDEGAEGGNCDYLRKLNLLRTSIFGVDIQPAAVEIAKLRCILALLAEDPGGAGRGAKPPSYADLNFVSANALTKPPEKLFGVSAFDIVISNPPYLGERRHKDLFDTLKKSPLGRKFYNGKMDLLYFFFHFGLDNLADGGLLSLITTNYYTTADGAIKLRKDLYERAELLELINFNEYRIFESALGQHNMITIARKSLAPDAQRRTKQTFVERKGGPNGDELAGFITGSADGAVYGELGRAALFDGDKKYIRFASGNSTLDAIPARMARSGTPLGALCRINQGVITGADRFTDAHARKYPGIEAAKGEGIFIFPKGELGALIGDDEIIKPWYKNSDILRYRASSKNDKELLYSNEEYELSERGKAYLLRFKPILAARREFVGGKRPWYTLHWGRSSKIFESPKIIAPQRSRQNAFAYNDIPWYGSADIYYITSEPNADVNMNMKALLGILNSRLMFMWLFRRGKRKGEMLELYGTPLSEIPIILPRAEIAKAADKLVSEIIDAKAGNPNADTRRLERATDEIVCELYGLNENEKAAVNGFWEEKRG